jgi:hypothetical protein
MDVQPASGMLGIGLGHEGGGKSMPLGDTLHQALQHEAVIGAAQRILAIAQIDLELRGRGLLDGALDRQALPRGAGVDGLEHHLVIADVGERQDLGLAVALAGDGRDRRLRPPLPVRRSVEEIELQLDCDAGCEAVRREAVQHAGQECARVPIEGRAVMVRHGGDDLPKRTLRPGHRHQRPRHGAAETVALALVPDQAALDDAVAGRLQGEDAPGHANPFGVELMQGLAREALAPQNSGEIGNENVDALYLGMLGEKASGFRSLVIGWHDKPLISCGFYKGW